MQIIKRLSEMIDDEIDVAIDYAKNAVLHKSDNLGEMFFELANDELEHVDRLHKAVVDKIKEAEDTGKTIPTGMMEIWEYLHKRQIERVDEARRYLMQFRA